jgi:hypothetical protein
VQKGLKEIYKDWYWYQLDDHETPEWVKKILKEGYRANNILVNMEKETLVARLIKSEDSECCRTHLKPMCQIINAQAEEIKRLKKLVKANVLFRGVPIALAPFPYDNGLR